MCYSHILIFWMHAEYRFAYVFVRDSTNLCVRIYVINEFSAILHCHSKRWTKKIKYRFFEMIFWWKKNEFFTYLNACKYANSVLIDTNALERRHLPYHYSDLHTGRIHFFANFFQYNWNCTNICNTTYTE